MSGAVFTLFHGGKTQHRYLEYCGTCKFVSVHLLTDFVYSISTTMCAMIKSCRCAVKIRKLWSFLKMGLIIS